MDSAFDSRYRFGLGLPSVVGMVVVGQDLPYNIGPSSKLGRVPRPVWVFGSLLYTKAPPQLFRISGGRDVASAQFPGRDAASP